MANLKILMLVTLGLSVGESASVNNTRPKTGCSDGKVRGVNLGGWFVMEPWITPKLFEEVNPGGDKIVDEYTYAQYLDPQIYKERMIRHWESFYSKEDLQTLVNAGISHFRIPVAYWYWDVEDGEPFPQPNMNDNDFQSPLFYLKRCLQWIEELGAQAILDLHTAPGSQNGYDNSGRRFPRIEEAEWTGSNYPVTIHNIARTLRIIKKYSAFVKNWMDSGVIRMQTIYGIGILNEPHICAGWNFNGEKWDICRDDFYPKAVETVRSVFHNYGPKIIIDVAGRAFTDFDDIFADPSGIEIDAHNYQCFGKQWNDVAQAWDGWQQHLEISCNNKDPIPESPLPVWAGEFSLAITECQKYLQGGYQINYVPPDFDPSVCNYYNSNFDGYSWDYKEFLQNFFLAQIDSFEVGAGWVFWTGKTEDHCAPEWDYLFLLEHDILPKDLCNRPHYC